MKKNAVVSIPTPCHEDWGKMSVTEKGKFCLSCKKEVVDFTSSSDREIVSYLNKATGSTCGRFMQEQLDRKLIEPRKTFSSWKYFFQVLIPAFLLSQRVEAQKTFSKGETSLTSCSKDSLPITMVGKVARPSLTISGKIVDATNNSPVSFASVLIKGEEIGTSTDSAGVFKMNLYDQKKSVTIVVSSIGYEQKEITISGDSSQTIGLIPAQRMYMGDFVVVKTRTKKKVKTDTTTSKISPITKIIDNVCGRSSFSIYPNPVSAGSFVNIDMKFVQKGEYTLQLNDLQANMLQQEKIQVPDRKFNFQLALNNKIEAGVYFLSIIGPANKLVHTSKIIVQ